MITRNQKSIRDTHAKKHNTKYSHEITREGGKERRKEHKKKIATKNQGKMKISI